MANALETRSDSITSFVRGTDQEWPFVTVNDFEVKGRNTRRNTQTELFAFCPILTTPEEKQTWSSYSVEQAQTWLQNSYKTAIKAYGMGEDNSDGEAFSYQNYQDKSIPELVYRIEQEWTFTPENAPGSWMPLWQVSPPPPDPFPINFNTLSSPDVASIVEYLQDKKEPIMTERLARHKMFRNLIFQYKGITDGYNNNNGESLADNQDGTAVGGDPSRERNLQEEDSAGTAAASSPAYNAEYENTEGYSFVLYPVYNSFEDNFDGMSVERNLTGVLISLIRWDWILSGVLRSDTKAIDVVFENTCGENVYTYRILGDNATFKGIGDWHEGRFEDQVVATTLEKFHGITMDGEACNFTLKVYPTLSLREDYDTDQAIIFTTILGVAFGFTALFFLFYVRVVQRRQAKVMATAARTNAIVSSLFPSNVRDRIMRDAEEAVNNKTDLSASPFLPGMGEAPKRKLKTFLDGEEKGPNSETQLVMFKTKPIADLFPETTVMFGDLVGFTGT